MSEQFNLTIEKGEDFTWEFLLTDKFDVPIDLTGNEFIFQAKYSPEDSEYLIYASTENGKIVFTNRRNGSVHFNILKEETVALSFSEAYQDMLWIHGDGTRQYMWHGKLLVESRNIANG